jgi:hypothetical protein
MAETKTVALRKPWGETVARVEIPNEVTGPDVIEHAGLVYVRKTHDAYHEATRLVVRD